jgi:hypothetical protein
MLSFAIKKTAFLAACLYKMVLPRYKSQIYRNIRNMRPVGQPVSKQIFSIGLSSKGERAPQRQNYKNNYARICISLSSVQPFVIIV